MTRVQEIRRQERENQNPGETEEAQPAPQEQPTPAKNPLPARYRRTSTGGHPGGTTPNKQPVSPKKRTPTRYSRASTGAHPGDAVRKRQGAAAPVPTTSQGEGQDQGRTGYQRWSRIGNWLRGVRPEPTGEDDASTFPRSTAAGTSHRTGPQQQQSLGEGSVAAFSDPDRDISGIRFDPLRVRENGRQVTAVPELQIPIRGGRRNAAAPSELDEVGNRLADPDEILPDPILPTSSRGEHPSSAASEPPVSRDSEPVSSGGEAHRTSVDHIYPARPIDSRQNLLASSSQGSAKSDEQEHGSLQSDPPAPIDQRQSSQQHGKVKKAFKKVGKWFRPEEKQS